MELFEKKSEMRAWSERMRCEGQKIAFVPTMGALHEGHLSLVRRARKENDRVVVSIFVNPTQFGPNEDLSAYPRPFERDVELLQKEACDVVFHPGVEEMYAKGETLTAVDVARLPAHLCGLSRPGHFRGVATVVTKLFNIVLPHRAYFGRKDYQQFLIIKKMSEDLDLFVEIIDCPIVRESDGLAMSSRNQYLTPFQRKKALVLSQALFLAQDKVFEGEKKVASLISLLEKKITSEVARDRIDYIKIVDPNTLEDINEIRKEALIALAVYFGKARLIDNLLIKVP